MNAKRKKRGQKELIQRGREETGKDERKRARDRREKR